MKHIKTLVKVRVILIPLIVIALLLEGVNVFLTNQVSTESVTVNIMTQEIEELEQKNFTLRSEILEYTSFDSVASRAAELGFAETKKNITLYNEPHVAIR